ncbi:MAG TPA: hypothetical protein VN455_08275 [Methanotrichaceae archaeon]|nr:hypothetical protein [Methanotrichaceae archaeon]
MKSSIKSLMLVAAVALCLMVVPAFSAPNIMDNKGPGNMGPDGNKDMGRFAGHDGSAPGCNGFPGDNTSMHKGFSIEHSGEGFAISGSQYHVLNVNVKGQVNLDPETIKGIASDNKTLGEIKSEAKAAINAATTYNGSLVFGKEMYVLRNIKWSEGEGENATMSADVAGPISVPDKLFNKTDMMSDRDNFSKLNETEIKAKFEAMKAKMDAEKAKIKAEIDSATVAGHISMNVTTSDDRFQVGQGQLTLNSTSYNAVVNMGHSMKGIFGMGGHMGMGMMGGHEGMGLKAIGLNGMGPMGNHNGKMGCQREMPGEN